MRLADCFIPALAYGQNLTKDERADPEESRQRLVRLLERARPLAHQAGFDDGDYREALFAVTAWLDESVMCSRWSGVERWRRAPLQRQYFRTSRAGVEFLERLQALGQGRRAVREVYYLMLCLGFRGKFSQATDEPALNQLKQDQLALLLRDSGASGLEAGAALFPDAYPQPTAHVPPPRKSWLPNVKLGTILGPLVLVAMLYMTYQVILASMIRDLSRMMH